MGKSPTLRHLEKELPRQEEQRHSKKPEGAWLAAETVVRSTLLQPANQTGKVTEDGGEGEIPLSLVKQSEGLGQGEYGGIYTETVDLGKASGGLSSIGWKEDHAVLHQSCRRGLGRAFRRWSK